LNHLDLSKHALQLKRSIVAWFSKGGDIETSIVVWFSNGGDIEGSIIA
jgi:hypothetical protein